MQKGVSLHVVLAIFSIPENNSRSVRKLIMVEGTEVDGVSKVYRHSSLYCILISGSYLFVYCTVYIFWAV